MFGQHDRGWTERDVFGKVRYMNAAGLERKADPKAYVAKVEQLERDVAEAAGDDAGYLRITTRSAGQSARPVRVSSRSARGPASSTTWVASPAASRSAAGRTSGSRPSARGDVGAVHDELEGPRREVGGHPHAAADRLDERVRVGRAHPGERALRGLALTQAYGSSPRSAPAGHAAREDGLAVGLRRAVEVGRGRGEHLGRGRPVEVGA